MSNDYYTKNGQNVRYFIFLVREVVVQGRLALSTFNKEVNGVKVEITKPVIKLSSFHLCGRKPVAEVATQTATSESTASRKSKVSAVKN